MRGISFEKYDSSILKVGGSFRDSDPVAINLDEDDKLTNIRLYSSAAGSGRFAGLRLETSKQKKVEAFAYGYSLSDSDEVKIQVGNGMESAGMQEVISIPSGLPCSLAKCS